MWGEFAASSLGSLRRRGPHGSQRAEFHGARFWDTSPARLFRSRQHGDLATENGRCAAGTDFRRGGLTLVSYRRDFLWIIRYYRPRAERCDGGGKAGGNDGSLGTELHAL